VSETVIVTTRFKLCETAEDSALLILDPKSAVTGGSGAKFTYGPAEKKLLMAGEGV
jgi:hypothetical protein